MGKQWSLTDPFIPLDHVIIDTLHLFLRISDNLIELLIRELKRQDAIEKKVTYNDGQGTSINIWQVMKRFFIILVFRFSGILGKSKKN